MKRRIFSVLTALALCLSLLPAPALALDPEEPGGAAPAAEGDPDGSPGNPWPCGGNVTATLVDGTLTISGEGAMADYASSRDLPWYSQIGSILTAVIGEGVTSIGSRAFYSCQGLTSVEIPESVTSIGARAFTECKVLSGIQLPSGLTSIGMSAFSYCSALTSIEIPSGVKTIGNTAFGSTGLTEVTIPDGVESIEAYAFSACKSLTTVTIPASVTTIGSNAFVSSPNAKIYYAGTPEQWKALIGNVGIGATDDQLVINPHEVTIEGGGEGAEGADTYSEGADVTVSAGTKYGYAFNGWTATGVTLADEDLANPNLTFTMPGEAVTLTANWVEAVAVDANNVGYTTV